MDVDDQIKCIKEICQKLKEITDLKFPAYGSLYFADTPFLPDSKLQLNADFCIGPHCGAMNWDCNVPMDNLYIIMILNQIEGPGSIETHKTLLQQGRTLLKEMAKNTLVQNAASPLMFHPDLHERNFFVSEEDPTIVSAIIDWQSTSIEPVFWYTDATPEFAVPIQDPKDEDKVEPKSEACAKAYDVCIQFFSTKLSAARALDEAYFRPLRYCYRIWEDGAVAFREELIQTLKLWKELGFTGSCPFPLPSHHEMSILQKDYKVSETAQQLKHSLSSLLNTASDGWVPSDDWEGTESAHRELFQGMLQELLRTEPDDDESIGGEDDLRGIWPFDLEQ
ncbi:hypothetical protein PTMSG1_07289 [Pyrenophora teres f. maculata]|nr:hypothetical protein PTMSG1_07289 [Pyrenophora teres f. maculata]